MTQDSINIWYAKKHYFIRFNGKIKSFSDYTQAKGYIDGIIQSAYFVQPQAKKVV